MNFSKCIGISTVKKKKNLIIDLNINNKTNKIILKIYFLKQTASTIQLNSLVPLNSLN